MKDQLAAIYLTMLLGLLIIGGGRYFSLDYYVRLFVERSVLKDAVGVAASGNRST